MTLQDQALYVLSQGPFDQGRFFSELSYRAEITLGQAKRLTETAAYEIIETRKRENEAI